jgi:hypothetical protein
MYIPEIIEVKDHLERMKTNGLLKEWELPYENLLTRRSAAIFFLTPVASSGIGGIVNELDKYEHFSYRVNSEKKLSALEYRVTFSEEERELTRRKEN